MNDFAVAQADLQRLQARLGECLTRDRGALYRRLRDTHRRLREGKPVERELASLTAALDSSSASRRQRLTALPAPTFAAELPINRRRDEIAAAIGAHSVVVVCGETGSGKTTQLPKICLSLGLGAGGLIGHTQPRRIAARSVAARIAAELDDTVGGAVGYKVRFSDRLGADTVIKLMTDGILLAETQHDRYLNQYEAIIIDEAHERSLNIDFLLGYLKRLLPRRPDLKLIITSATIDPRSFSRHFNDAPVIEVSGRAYPVDIRYRPPPGEAEDPPELDPQQAILDAVDEVSAIDRGDILIFLSGEREIRETAESLRKHHPPDSEILPLYARLNAAEQDRVFQPHGRRRIVLATNVAETSLTVPGIRYVIDPGLARISRYSHRSQVQRLPIEKISQASAAQRAGRCGRVAAGVCIRLYGEDEFRARPAFTEPAILRTNLAAVILQMLHLGLGEVEDFPFMDPPDSRLINDGYRLLFELQAVDERRRITELGRQLARFPIDPRLGRMILAARAEGCLREVMIIASALSIQDPRERPLEHQQAADTQHRRFQDERSDFLALLKLWDYYHEQAQHLSKNKLRALCREDFLSASRMQDWRDLHQELQALVTEMGLRPNETPAEYEPLHRAVLAGLLGNLGCKQEEQAWLGARNRKFHIFPASGLFRKGPKWLMAAEVVETAKIYARTVARVEPEWAEAVAGHLVKRSYSDPHWEKRAAQVVATERVTLYGLPLVVGRKVNYGPIDPVLSREIFIRHALARGEFQTRAAFFQHNRELIAAVEDLEAKSRRRDLLVDEETLFRFYDARVPTGIVNGPLFERWRKRAERDQPRLLFLTTEDLLARDASTVTAEQYPDRLAINGMELPLSYRFEPGAEDDGVTLTVPLAAMNQLNSRRPEWLVPGLLDQRMAALLKSLPKSLRKHFVPVPNYVDVLREALEPGDESLTDAMAAYLRKVTGVTIPPEAWQVEALPAHVRMRFQVVDGEGQVLGQGRDWERLKADLREQSRASFAALPPPAFERESIKDWDFGDLPEQVEFVRDGVRLLGYPALVEQADGGLALRLLDTPERAAKAMKEGLRRLIRGRLRDAISSLQRQLPGFQRMGLHYVRLGTQEELKEDLLTAIIDRVFLSGEHPPRDQAAFQACLERGRERLFAVATELGDIVARILGLHHEIGKALNGEFAWFEATADIRDQLDWLVYKGFIQRTPAAWMKHLPRYLQAIQARLRKVKEAPDRDRLRRAEMGACWENCKVRYGRREEQGGEPPELAQYRWMVEELRVSLFAQELKTALPVSLKRLEEQWAKVQG